MAVPLAVTPYAASSRMVRWATTVSVVALAGIAAITEQTGYPEAWEPVGTMASGGVTQSASLPWRPQRTGRGFCPTGP
jgi:hypothetical protein